MKDLVEPHVPMDITKMMVITYVQLVTQSVKLVVDQQLLTVLHVTYLLASIYMDPNV